MENSENPSGTKIINNLTALKFFEIATAILKNYALLIIHYLYFLKEMSF